MSLLSSAPLSLLRLSVFSLSFAGAGMATGGAGPGDGDLAVGDLRIEHLENPVGIDERAPRLSWILRSEKRATVQVACRLQVGESDEALRRGEVLWDTGKVESDRSLHFDYGGPELESAKRYFWRVRVWDNHGRDSGWSEVAFWETGLLEPDDWRAQWIEPDLEEDTSTSPPAPMLRREFSLKGEIRSARAYVTAHGVYEMEINGARVGDQVLSPGWTSYHNRLQYQTYDVTDSLRSGDNAVGVVLGDGWYRGYIGFRDQRNFYGERLALLAQLRIVYEDGRTEWVVSDGAWKAGTGPILKSDIYNGESYDARRERTGWSEPGYEDDDWAGVRIADHGTERLIAQQAPPVRKIQALTPREILVTPEGDTVVDMGQNMIGWIRLRVEGEAGDEVVLRHAEVLDRDGNFYTENLRAAKQTNRYILKGGGEEVWEPRFTFQGFRYVAVSGYPGELTVDDVTGIVLHSDMEPTGHFQSSNPLLNQLQHNIVWGQKGNFLEIPTDCPQRDERLGWTGDIQVFAPTANLNMNTAAFLAKWLADLEADQLENGSIPHVVPNVLGENWSGAAGWADAGVIVPWALYQSFGDTRILKRRYGSMKAWVDYVAGRAAARGDPYLWEGDFTFGDWLSFSTTRSDYPGAFTDKDLIATAFFARSASLLSDIAGVLGKDDERARYAELSDKVGEAFRKEYVTPRGRVLSNTQTSYLLALRFDLLSEETRPAAAGFLVESVQRHGHLTTGFLGTPHLNPVLSEIGHSDLAYRLLLRTDYPSWLYPVTQGATTIWERWDGIKPDGSFQDRGMNSFNHYAYGAIGQWLMEEVAGIQPAAPGYREVRIAPGPGGGLDHAGALLDSPYGRVESSWEIREGDFVLDIRIPANTTGIVLLPHAVVDTLTMDGAGPDRSDGIRSIEQAGDRVEVRLGSGRYRFSYPSGEWGGGADETGDEAGSDSLDPAATIGTHLADRRAREVWQRRVPQLMESPWLSQVMGFPLEAAARALPADLGALLEKNRTAITRELEQSER